MLSSHEVWKLWHSFRESKNHIHLPPASLIADKNSTALFTVAGMQPLIPYLSGQEHPLGTRLYNIQHCIRTNDLEEVGDNSHHTMFFMMGNRSLGDYFKKDAIWRSWEFLTQYLKLDPRKLAVTAYEGDDIVPADMETVALWKAQWVSEDKISLLSADDNRRSPGPVWPCGPCTEIYYWIGDTELPWPDDNVKADDNKWLEIWNNVFMEFYMKSEEIVAEEIKKDLDTMTDVIIWCAIDIHKKYKNTLTEKQINTMLYDKLLWAWFSVEREKSIDIIEDGKKYWSRFVDIVVNNNIYIELKNNSNDNEIKKWFLQTRNYLELWNGIAGLLLNFAFSTLSINRFNYLHGAAYQNLLQTSKLSSLPLKNVDTGMWFERINKVLQQKLSPYETDLFAPIIQVIEKITHQNYALFDTNTPTAEQQKIATHMRIIADHMRSSTLLIAEWLLPSNEWRGYVLRRIMRRLYFHINELLWDKADFKETIQACGTIIDTIISHYEWRCPHLHGKNDSIKKAFDQELTQFAKTLNQWQKIVQKMIDDNTDTKILPGNDIFMLYDTFWFPIELTREIATKQWITLDDDGFEQAMEQAKEKSRANTTKVNTKDVDRSIHIAGVAPTQFIGYTTFESEDITLLKKISFEWYDVVIFDKTPCYATMGGQLHDNGVWTDDDGQTYTIFDVQNYNGVFLHFIK